MGQGARGMENGKGGLGYVLMDLFNAVIKKHTHLWLNINYYDLLYRINVPHIIEKPMVNNGIQIYCNDDKYI